MEPITLRILIWISAFLIAWTAARTVVAVMKSNASDNAKAAWIALAICTPIIGPIVYWLLGHAASGKEELDAREVQLKARLNSR